MDTGSFHFWHLRDRSSQLPLQGTPIVQLLDEFRHPNRRAVENLKPHAPAMRQSL